jgi:hypothetical protein
MTNREERLAAIRRELQNQNEAWQRASEALSRAGDILIAVPGEMLEALGAPAPTTPVLAGTPGIRA